MRRIAFMVRQAHHERNLRPLTLRACEFISNFGNAARISDSKMGLGSRLRAISSQALRMSGTRGAAEAGPGPLAAIVLVAAAMADG